MRVSRVDGVVVIGDGVVGLCIALHASSRGVPVTLVTPSQLGAASPASAGMLAPSVERTQGVAQAFSDEARNAWPRMASLIRDLGGPPFEVRRNGIMRVARSAEEAGKLRDQRGASDVWLSPDDVRRREPSLAETAGAVLHLGDGVVDVPECLASLRQVLAARQTVQRRTTPARSVAIGPARITVVLRDGSTIETERVVVAAGAWSPSLEGLRRQLPVRPLRGAVLSIPGIPLHDPVYPATGHGYLFPRAGRLMVGATSDDVGFDASPSADDAERLVTAVGDLIPGIEQARRGPVLVGLRPVTPDGLAIIGHDHEVPGLVYATGHGRNGFLEAALTGEVVTDLLQDKRPVTDISPFSPARFPS